MLLGGRDSLCDVSVWSCIDSGVGNLQFFLVCCPFLEPQPFCGTRLWVFQVVPSLLLQLLHPDQVLPSPAFANV